MAMHWLVFAILVAGCTQPPIQSTVVARVVSPNGASVAILVDRRYQAMGIAEEYFVTIVGAGQSEDSALAVRHLGETSAFVATRASKLRLEWHGTDTLALVCDSCGLQAVDIERRGDHLNGIAIKYMGVPSP